MKHKVRAIVFLFLMFFVLKIGFCAEKKNIAVVLSGCGGLDGSEINEAVLTLLAIELSGNEYQCFAPDKKQLHVVNHLTQKVEENQERNILIESARIARGNILSLAKLELKKFDAVILPGGYGAAKNLSDFFSKGAGCEVDKELAVLLKKAQNLKKPLGFICIAPAIAASVFGEDKVKLTIGKDPQTAEALEKMGAKHIKCLASKSFVDEDMKIVTTPAFMSGKSLSEVFQGIKDLVDQIILICE